jgi:hypothetical protein
MSANLVALVGLIYLLTMGALVHEGRYAMAIVFFGYALSNAGFYFAMK